MAIKRSSNFKKCLILDDDKKEILIFHSKLEKDLNINGIIRIHKKDYKYIDKNSKYLTHFNLEICNHKKGKIYALPKIIRSGEYRDDKNEILPLLDFNNCLYGECVEVKKHVKYIDLNKNDFKYSMKNIQNTEELKKEILWRYSKSLPELTKEEILKNGVSITKIKINDK